MTETPRYRLELVLPAGWNLVNGSALHAGLEGAEGPVTGLAQDVVILLLDTESVHTDLAATVYIEVSGVDGEPIGTLAAAMVASSISAAELPDEDHPGFTMQRVDGVELLEGLPSSYLVITLPVVSDDGQLAELLTFSSPNIGLAPLLEPTFRAISESARLRLSTS